MTARLRIAFALLWLAVLLFAGWWIGAHLQLTGDLRKFMPAQDTPGRGHDAEAARAACDDESPAVPSIGIAGIAT